VTVLTSRHETSPLQVCPARASSTIDHPIEPQVRTKTSTRSAPYRAGKRTRNGSGVKTS
jgi:hypothetical protein